MLKLQKIILLVFAFLMFYTLHAQSQIYSRVKIYTDAQSLEELIRLGVGVDHGTVKKNTFFISDFSQRDIELLKEHGYKHDILIEDVTAFYVKRNDEAVQNQAKSGGQRNSCSSSGATPSPTYATPENFHLGEMGGFYTYYEYLTEIDEMVEAYPQLISPKTPIDTFITVEGRPLYYLKISSSPNAENNKPYVFYNSIHHAREPGSLSQLIYYMWYLLENYETDGEVKYLVDNTQMIFVPVINPDGYVHNSVNNPNGGGMWRKNKRDNGDGTFGVDLNRNYNYEWNTTGVSADTDSDIYPGISAFSEVETQAIRWLVQQFPFQFALNAHTYSNLLLYPIGASDEEFAEHHDYFDHISGHMCKHNGYDHIKSSELYPASGGSDDYMYKMDIGVGVKDTMFSMTPEIGSEFWPESTKIEEICNENVFPNLILAHLPHRFAVVVETDPSTLDELSGNFTHTIQRLGLEDGVIEVSISPIQGIQSVGQSIAYDLALKESTSGQIPYTLENDLTVGSPIVYELITDNGLWKRRDTIRKSFGTPTLQFEDNAENTSNWTGDVWTTTTEAYVSGPSSFTDSPNGDYFSDVEASYTLVESVDLTTATAALVRFYAKWEVEDNWDYVAFEISTDNQNSWQPLCGKYTNEGVEQPGWNGTNQGIQPVGLPIYDGSQSSWVEEEIDLTGFLGETISLRFRIHTDGAEERDGFYFDDFQLLYTTTTASLSSFPDNEVKVYPNPVQDEVSIYFNSYIPTEELLIYDVAGNVVLRQSLNGMSKKTTLSVQDLSEGVYVLRFTDPFLQHLTKRIIVVK